VNANFEKIVLDESLPPIDAARQVLTESFSAGETVAFAEDPIHGLHGGVGKVKGGSERAGYVDVELANGTVLAVMSNLLLRA
jgi:hypothetical protein